MVVLLELERREALQQQQHLLNERMNISQKSILSCVIWKNGKILGFWNFYDAFLFQLLFEQTYQTKISPTPCEGCRWRIYTRSVAPLSPHLYAIPYFLDRSQTPRCKKYTYITDFLRRFYGRPIIFGIL